MSSAKRIDAYGLSFLDMDPNTPVEKIPRPPNAFILYRKDNSVPLRAKFPGLENAVVSKVIAEMWKTDSDKTRNAYKNLAKKVKRLHQQKFPNYLYNPRSTTERKRRMTETKVAQVPKLVRGILIANDIDEATAAKQDRFLELQTPQMRARAGLPRFVYDINGAGYDQRFGRVDLQSTQGDIIVQNAKSFGPVPDHDFHDNNTNVISDDLDDAVFWMGPEYNEQKTAFENAVNDVTNGVLPAHQTFVSSQVVADASQQIQLLKAQGQIVTPGQLFDQAALEFM